MNTKQPIVFISHAWEDKERFVIPFAEKLMNNGIDVWVDQWEMLPGDSIIEKIFDEGIKNADVFVMVLSDHSVQSRWVREELNVGLIKRISEDFKVIPIIIDDCDIPEALKPILWVRIKDLDNYVIELERIIAAIHGNSLKPSIGIPPRYTQLTIDAIPGLSQIDMLVLKTSCDCSIEGGNPFVTTSDIKDTLDDLDISQEMIYESLEILDEKYYIKAVREMGSSGINFYQITTHGFENYARLFISEFDSLVNLTLAAIINEGQLINKDLSKHLGVSVALIDYILDILASRNYIKIVKTMGGGVSVLDITASGKRAASII